MRKTTLNAIVDTIAFFPLLVTAVTGIIIWLTCHEEPNLLPSGQYKATKRFWAFNGKYGLTYTRISGYFSLPSWPSISSFTGATSSTYPGV